MGLFSERWPYSNLHDLNLDWIITAISDFLKNYQNLNQELITVTDEELARLQAWYDEYSVNVNTQLNNALEELSTETVQKILEFELACNVKAQELFNGLPLMFIPLYNLVILNGYYQPDNDFNFVSDDGFQCIKLAVVAGEHYKITTRVRPATDFPIAYFLDSENNILSTTATVTEITTFRSYPVTIPENCTYMVVMNDKGYGTATTNVDLTIEKEIPYLPYNAPLAGKKVLIFGDSYSAVKNRWREEFYKRTKAIELCCISRGGAHLCDYDDTVLDGNYYTEIPGSESNNTINNMITYVATEPPNANPDIIIIEAYINDDPTREQLTNYTNEINNGTNPAWINYETVDRTITEGAMRWQMSKLRRMYPNAQIIYISPIETAYYDVEYMKLKDDKMTDMTQRLACDIVHGIRCGITAEFETIGENGRFLSDGLHTNEAGGILLGRYIAQMIANIYANRML